MEGTPEVGQGQKSGREQSARLKRARLSPLDFSAPPNTTFEGWFSEGSRGCCCEEVQSRVLRRYLCSGVLEGARQGGHATKRFLEGLLEGS